MKNSSGQMRQPYGYAANESTNNIYWRARASQYRVTKDRWDVVWEIKHWGVPTINMVIFYLLLDKLNKEDLSFMYFWVFRCEFIDLVYFWLYRVTPSSETQGQSVGKLSSRLFSRIDWLPLGLRGWSFRPATSLNSFIYVDNGKRKVTRKNEENQYVIKKSKKILLLLIINLSRRARA